ncbi:MAG: ClbS/DfsB family four-helix bundle protein [Phycisphaerae bacterium]|nr:ClbS/DfsB family four-helix bundle protein [Phycisphaerae bacterium]
MPTVTSRRDLLEEIDAEYARVTGMIDRVPPGLWKSSRVNGAGWSLKDVLAHVADWAERCDVWCGLGDTLHDMTPPAAGFKWNETRELNHAIYLKRRRHSLARVLRDFRAGHAGLWAHAATMSEGDLIAVGRFAWCGTTWSIAKHIRANTAAPYRWACKHFKAALKAAGVDEQAEKIARVSPGARGTRRTTRQSRKKTR